MGSEFERGSSRPPQGSAKGWKGVKKAKGSILWYPREIGPWL